MSITLPKPIAEFFVSDRNGNAQAVSECFTQDAVVIDEKNTYTGRDAIRQWMANTSTKYSYTTEPFALKDEGGKTIVSAHLVGDFPGSPVDLRYFFAIEGDKISELEITL